MIQQRRRIERSSIYHSFSSRNLERGILAIVLFISVYAPFAIGAVHYTLRLPIFAALVLGYILWIARIAITKVLLWHTSVVNYPVIALLLYITARYFFTPVEYTARHELLMWYGCVALFFLVLNNLNRHEHVSIILNTQIVACLLCVIYGLVQYFRGSNYVFHILRVQYEGRTAGTFYCPK